MAEIIVGITGASGIVLGHRTVDVLASTGHRVHLILSRAALCTAQEEMGADFASTERFLNTFSLEQRQMITVHKIGDFNAPIASGSYPVDGMVVIPCSMATLSAIAIGMSDNLLRRAADVMLKERRRLVIVPREAPFSEIHLENMLRLTRIGAVILPPVPAWYTKPKTLQDVEDFIVGRALDGLNIDAKLYPRWGMGEEDKEGRHILTLKG